MIHIILDLNLEPYDHKAQEVSYWTTTKVTSQFIWHVIFLIDCIVVYCKVIIEHGSP